MWKEVAMICIWLCIHQTSASTFSTPKPTWKLHRASASCNNQDHKISLTTDDLQACAIHCINRSKLFMVRDNKSRWITRCFCCGNPPDSFHVSMNPRINIYEIIPGANPPPYTVPKPPIEPPMDLSGCSYDTQCKGDRICVDRECSDPDKEQDDYYDRNYYKDDYKVDEF